MATYLRINLPALKVAFAQSQSSQTIIASRTGINQTNISKYLSGETKSIGSEKAYHLAKALDLQVPQIIEQDGDYSNNPSPMRVGATKFDALFLITGDHKQPLDFVVKYTDKSLELPSGISPQLFKNLAEQAKKEAESRGNRYYNGLNTRLSGTSPDGATRFALELAPVSWDEFSVLNTFLDVPNLIGRSTIRQTYAENSSVFDSEGNFDWCKLSNILCVAMVPVTTDGFGLFKVRSGRTVSVAQRKITSGLAENIDRYQDQAQGSDGDNLRKKIVHSLGAETHNYTPKGVPSPYLTVERGMSEEISSRISEYYTPKEDIHFLSLVFDLVQFHPVLCGIVNVRLSKDSLKKLMESYSDTDSLSEAAPGSWEYVKLDSADREAQEYLKTPNGWTGGGLAAFISALNYYEAL